MRNTMGIIFCFYNRNWIVCTEKKNIICTFWLLSENKVSFQINLSICNAGFHGNLFTVPFRSNGRSNILEFNILFTHLFFRYNRTHIYSSLHPSSFSGRISTISSKVQCNVLHILTRTSTLTSSFLPSLAIAFVVIFEALIKSVLLIPLSIRIFHSLL